MRPLFVGVGVVVIELWSLLGWDGGGGGSCVLVRHCLHMCGVGSMSRVAGLCIGGLLLFWPPLWWLLRLSFFFMF